MKAVGTILLLVLGFAGFLALVIGLDLGGLLYQKETAGFRGRSEAERNIQRGTSRIQRYEEFFNLCSSVQKAEAAIDSLEANKTMNVARRDEAITAQRIARRASIADYNRRAVASYTSGQFRDSQLPYTLQNTRYEAGRNNTNCIVE